MHSSQAILEQRLVLLGLELLHFLNDLGNLHQNALRLFLTAHYVILLFFGDGLHDLEGRSDDLDVDLDIFLYALVALFLDVVAINTDEVLEEIG